MSNTARILKALIRLSGGGALLLGLAVWAGYALGWVPVHMLFGVTMVFSMWVTAALAIRAGTRPGFATLVALWGLAVVIFGRLQMRLMPGPHHWVIALTHLLAGGLAMGMGVSLATAVERSATNG